MYYTSNEIFNFCIAIKVLLYCWLLLIETEEVTQDARKERNKRNQR